MPVLVTCPKCRLEGSLPDDEPGGVIACPACGTEFAPPAAPAPPPDEQAVWVGTGAPPTATATPPPRRGLTNPLPTAPDGKPVEITAANAGKHLEWVRAELARFDAYVAGQLEVLRRRRAEITAQESASGASLVARDLLASRERAALEADRAALAAEREALARRAEALDRAEQAFQRRLAEVDELEQELRGELEAREAEVERQRRAVAEALADLRARAPLSATTADDLLDPGHCG